MTERERQLQTALNRAFHHLAEALEWCPDGYGAKDDLRQALQKVDSFRAWFEQTHA